jgi:hypothetical protein
MSRDEYWENELRSAITPKDRVRVLQNKLLADTKKLPEEYRDAAQDLLALRLEDAIGEIQIKIADEVWA